VRISRSIPHEREVGEQVGRPEVVVAGTVRRPARYAVAGVRQLQLHAPPLEPVGLVRVDPPHPRVEVGQHREVAVDARQQLDAGARELG
jgi:hypothetical protein